MFTGEAAYRAALLHVDGSILVRIGDANGERPFLSAGQIALVLSGRGFVQAKGLKCAVGQGDGSLRRS